MDLLIQQDAHLQTVVEVLQSIKASEMTPMLQRIYGSDGGSELLDVLMKYLWVEPLALLFYPRRPLMAVIPGTNDICSVTRAWRRRPGPAVPVPPPK